VFQICSPSASPKGITRQRQNELPAPTQIMSDQNPYASPISAPPKPPSAPTTIDLEPKDRRKIKALISDANGFWLAIPMSILCYGCGAIVLPTWYSLRLLQWKSLANKYPALLIDGAPRGSIQAKFKSSHWKLILGIAVGCLLLLVIVILILVQYFSPIRRI